MRQSATTAIRAYRIYFRDGDDRIARAQEVELTSDEAVCQLAAQILEERAADCTCAEVWDRARLVCALRRDGLVNRQRPEHDGRGTDVS